MCLIRSSIVFVTCIVIEGVFLAATGELHLLSSVEATEMLFLQLPRKLPDEKVSSTRSAPEPLDRKSVV